MSSTITSVIVHGASGRMGARLCSLIAEDPRFTLVGALARPGSPSIGSPAAHAKSTASTVKITASCEHHADVVIDFSSDEGARAALHAALQRRAALLVGTTALAELTAREIRAASSSIPVIIAPNTSLGIPVLARAAADVARALGPSFEISIVEAHHSRKKDAPSGTALRLADAIRHAGATITPEQVLAMRGGDVVGEHTIRFAGPGEYIELTHRATSRDVFVHGAMRAALWLKGRAPSLYTIEDVLGLPPR